MPHGTFAEYLAKRRISANPSGAFTREARDDPGIEGIESWPALQAYLFRKHGAKVKEVIAAAEPVWKGYRAHVLNRRRDK
jgi:hypothetical protein